MVDRARGDGHYCRLARSTNRHPIAAAVMPNASSDVTCFPWGMRSSGNIPRVAATSRRDDSETIPRNRIIRPDDVESDRRVYVAASKIEPHEWMRLDPDGEISKLMNGESSTARSNPTKGCYRTSISSGYSSHYSPLSAGSYSCYAPVSTSTRDHPSWYDDLAVIHETETVPRPIWPSALYRHPENCNIELEDIYTCHACGCTYGFAPGTMPLPATRATREREMLLELSRILHSVIDGGAGVTLEDILCDISRIVPLGNGMGNDHVYEYVHPSWMFSDKNLSISPPSYVKSQVPSRRTLADPKLCIAPRYSYEYNYARSVPFPKNDAEEVTKCERNKKSSSHAEEESCDKANNSHCKYLHENNGAKQSLEPDRDSKRCRDDRASSESIHPTSEGSDTGSSNEAITTSLNGTDWNHHHHPTIRGLGKTPDFTLDVTRAEHLGRTIARAKRKRQWCRVLTTLFGLVFFVLSVVVVSLSVTRGRKVFGSM